MSNRLRALNASAIRQNVNASRDINQSIRRLRERLGSTKPVRRRTSTRTSTKTSKKTISTDSSSGLNILYFLLGTTLIILILYFFYNYFMVPTDRSAEIEQRLMEKTQEMIERRLKNAPKGQVDIPRQMGAPIKGEEKSNIAGNPYLYLYGSPDSPGFASYPGHRPPGYRHTYTAWGRNPGEKWTDPWFSPWNRYRNTRSKDYYVQESTVNVPREKLNEYVEEQNQYIKRVNDRVRQINEKRIYSPRYLRHSAELSELRDFERRLANKVHREQEEQPPLPDMGY